MEETNGDPGRITHSVNDTDTPDFAARSGVFLFRPPAPCLSKIS